MNQRQRINLQNIQTARAAQYQKNKQPNPKMGRRPKQTFLQRRHTDGQQTHEKMLNITNYQRNANQNYNGVKMLNITNYQRNANQNYNEVSSHTSQNGHHQKIDKQ